MGLGFVCFVLSWLARGWVLEWNVKWCRRLTVKGGLGWLMWLGAGIMAMAVARHLGMRRNINWWIDSNTKVSGLAWKHCLVLGYLFPSRRPGVTHRKRS